MRKSVIGIIGIAAMIVSVSSAPLFGNAATEKSLYDRLGKKKAIAAVVDEFVARVAADKRINSYFGATASDPARLKTFKSRLVEQICQASGGPCKYTGKDMKTAHMGMGVSGADFDALVEDLVGALDKFKVGAHEKDQLLGALGPMKTDIVERK
jgi:hemoglobin